jgi:hypothetical protein
VLYFGLDYRGKQPFHQGKIDTGERVLLEKLIPSVLKNQIRKNERLV